LRHGKARLRLLLARHYSNGGKRRHVKCLNTTRGGRRRPEKGVLLKCELNMGAPAGNNQAQYQEVVMIALEIVASWG